MKYTTTRHFPNGISHDEALTLQPGQYISLFSSTRPSRFVGVKQNGTIVAMHSSRDGITLSKLRKSGRAGWVRVLGA
jgi:hypothetical protein